MTRSPGGGVCDLVDAGVEADDRTEERREKRWEAVSGCGPGSTSPTAPGGGEVQGIDIDLPNLDIDPPSLEIDPRKMDIDLRSLDIDLPSLDIHLPKIEIHPPSLDLELPNLDIDPPKMNIDPPGVDVECFCIKVDVPGMSGRGLARRPPAVGLRWGCCRRRNPCVSGCS